MTKSLSNAELMAAAPSLKGDGSEDSDKND
jgi:hypothetical protein